MIVIPLESRKYGKQCFFIDGEDFDKIEGYTWHIVKNKNNLYVAADINRKPGRKSFRLHRVIMDCPKDKMVDHKNHNTLDNTRQNLRICENSENKRNGLKYKGCLSNYKGVHPQKQSGKFIAAIRYNGDFIYLGLYEYEINAAKAYNEAALKYYGEFAELNIIDNDHGPEEKVRKQHSKFRGISYNKNRGTFFCNFVMFGKKIHLGVFKTELEAAIAYNDACDKYGVPERKNILPEEL